MALLCLYCHFVHQLSELLVSWFLVDVCETIVIHMQNLFSGAKVRKKNDICKRIGGKVVFFFVFLAQFKKMYYLCMRI